MMFKTKIIFIMLLLGFVLGYEEKSGLGNFLSRPKYCYQHPTEGMKWSCLAYMPRLYYDFITDSCVKFIYGGCGGTKNNFSSLQDCMFTCRAGAGKRPDDFYIIPYGNKNLKKLYN